MIRKTRLFTPGPTPLLPAAQNAIAAADMHHRTAEFREIFSRTLADLKTFIGTNNDVLILASSGTGAMEAAVSNLTSPGEKVVVLTAGKFGERWRDLAKAYGCEIEMLSVPYGETFDLREVKSKLDGARVLYMQATETSTGARHDVKAIAALLKGTDTLLVVDGITGLGTTHFDVDDWGIDILIGGSQKAVMIPPGLAYLSVSERAWQRMETAKQPRFYFDLRKERKSQTKGESAFTPAVALICGLGAALDYIRKSGNGNLADGRDALIHNAETSAAMVRAGVQALGLGLFAPTCPSAAVHRGAGAQGRGLQRDREGVPRALCHGRRQWPGRHEGQAVPHRASRLLRLSRRDRRDRCVGACAAEGCAISQLRTGRWRARRAGSLCRAIRRGG